MHLTCPAARKEAKSLKGQQDLVTGLAFLPDNARLLSIGFDRYLHLWDTVKGAETKKLGPTPDDLYGLALARDGKTAATSGYGGHVTLWDLAAGKAVETHKLVFGAYCIAFTPDGKAVVTGHENGHCYVTALKGK